MLFVAFNPCLLFLDSDKMQLLCNICQKNMMKSVRFDLFPMMIFTGV